MRSAAILRILGGLAAAACLAAAVASAHAEDLDKAAVHQVSVAFNPRTITLGESSNFTVVLKNPQGGGNRTGVGWILALPTGLTTPGVNIHSDCSASGRTFSAIPSITIVLFTGLSLPPGGTCTVHVTVVPRAAGNYTYAANALVVNSNSGSNSNAAGATLVVNPAPLPTAQLSAPGIAFGTQAVGSTSAARTLTISNTGGGALALGAVSVAGDFASSGCAATSLAPDASCTLSVSFRPNATGTRTGSVTVASNAPGSPHTISLSGTGTAPAAALTPSSVSFGSVHVGTTAAATVTLANPGNAALSVSGIAATGSFFTQSNTCSALAPSETCSIVVTYAPTGAGTHSGQLTVHTNAAGGPLAIALSGSATPAPAPMAVLSASTMAFGSIAVGSNSSSPVTLSNGGTAPLAIAAITTSGSFFAHTHACPASLSAGASCVITASYAPAATGAHSGQLSVQTNAAGSPAMVGLSGSAIPAPAPAAVLSRASVDFGSQAAGSASAAQSVTLSNTGNAALSVTSISVSGEFTVSGCAAPTTLPAGGSCTLSIVFLPTGTGARSGAVQIATNSPGTPLAVALSGSGAAPGVSLAPSPVDFGSIVAGSSAAATVTLTNTGGATLSGLAVSVGGAFFSLSQTTCSTSLAPQASCTTGVGYAPTAQGSHAGQLSVQSNAGPYVVSLFGIASAPPAPALTLSRSSIAFGSQQVSSSSAAQTVTLTNSGNASLNIASLSHAGDFASSGCVGGTALPAGATCTLSIQFSPTATGARSGSIQVATNAPGSPHSITLSGTGTAPAAELAPAAVSFGNVAVGASATSNVTLTNVGSAALAISAIATTGAGFAQSHGCPPSLAPAASCVISLTFAPASTGSHAGQLSVTSNAAPAVASLAGNATPSPAPALAVSPTSLAFGSVALGESASTAVTLSNTGNAPLTVNSVSATGDYTYSGCTTPATLAAGGSCTFSVTFTPAAAGARAGTVQVASNAPGSPHTIALSGVGTARPGLALGPEALDYSAIPAKSSVLSRVTLRSTGTGPLAILSISIEGAFYSQTNQCPASLAPESSCDIWVEFAPTETGTHAGRLVVQTDASPTPSVVALSGTAIVPQPPRLEISRTSIAFGPQTVGVAGSRQTVLLTSTGHLAVDIGAITIAGDFGFEGCATPLTLAGGEACELAIKFLPTAVGARSGSLSISSNVAGSPHSVALQGEGTATPVPGIAVAPASVEFGTVVAGQRLVARLAITNTGKAPLAISGMGTTAPEFSHASTCPAMLPPSEACEVSVTYAPVSAGAHGGELHVRSNAVPSPLVVPLAGRAQAAPTPRVQLSSTHVAFAPHFVGVTSTPKTVTLLNNGSEALRITGIESSGDFGYGGCGYPATLAAGDSCVFAITFKPLSVGEQTGSILIASNAPGSPHTITLSGRGASFAVPEISLAPSHLTFPSQPVDAVATQRMRLRNAGASTLEISAIRAAGAHFTQGNDCPAALVVGAGCDIVVTYAPNAIGVHAGHVIIESNAVPSPHAAPLSGIAVAVPPPFLTVDRVLDFGQQVIGTTAREGLRLTNTGGNPLIVTAARILGAPEFGVEPGCATIAPAASCVLELIFTPTALREFAARLDIVSNHSGGVVQVDLAGAGVPKALPDLELSVAGLGWGNQTVGTLGEERIVKLTSIGGEALRINAITASPDFVVDAGQCPALLDPKRSCEVRVTFRPLTPGPRQGRLTIDSNATGGPDSVSLTGVGCRLFAMGAARNPSRLCAP